MLHGGMAKKEHRGTRIRRLREAKGLTMEQMADRIGVTRQSISRIETTGGISVRNVIPLAMVLGVDPVDLLR